MLSIIENQNIEEVLELKESNQINSNILTSESNKNENQSNNQNEIKNEKIDKVEVSINSQITNFEGSSNENENSDENKNESFNNENEKKNFEISKEKEEKKIENIENSLINVGNVQNTLTNFPEKELIKENGNAQNALKNLPEKVEKDNLKNILENIQDKKENENERKNSTNLPEKKVKNESENENLKDKLVNLPKKEEEENKNKKNTLTNLKEKEKKKENEKLRNTLVNMPEKDKKKENEYIQVNLQELEEKQINENEINDLENCSGKEEKNENENIQNSLKIITEKEVKKENENTQNLSSNILEKVQMKNNDNSKITSENSPEKEDKKSDQNMQSISYDLPEKKEKENISNSLINIQNKKGNQNIQNTLVNLQEKKENVQNTSENFPKKEEIKENVENILSILQEIEEKKENKNIQNISENLQEKEEKIESVDLQNCFMNLSLKENIKLNNIEKKEIKEKEKNINKNGKNNIQKKNNINTKTTIKENIIDKKENIPKINKTFKKDISEDKEEIIRNKEKEALNNSVKEEYQNDNSQVIKENEKDKTIMTLDIKEEVKIKIKTENLNEKEEKTYNIFNDKNEGIKEEDKENKNNKDIEELPGDKEEKLENQNENKNNKKKVFNLEEKNKILGQKKDEEKSLELIEHLKLIQNNEINKEESNKGDKIKNNTKKEERDSNIENENKIDNPVKDKNNNNINNKQKEDREFILDTDEKEDINKSTCNLLNEEEKEYYPKGIKNLGLSCYMNSLLHCLFNITELRKFFIFCYENKKFDKDTQPINYNFAKVMHELLYLDANYINPEYFRKAIGSISNLFSDNKAADATDLFRNLIDSFLTELTPTGDEGINFQGDTPMDKETMLNIIKKEIESNNIIYKYINVYTLTQYKCPAHKGEIYSYESDSNITFFLDNIIKNKKDKSSAITLRECFLYLQNEKENDEFFCPQCNKIIKGNSFDKIVCPPKILVIILNRGKGKKVTNRVIIDTILDISDFIDKNENRESIYYKLIGSCNHTGDSSPSGHYTATCLYKNKYHYFNDSCFQKLSSFQYLGEPYILFYRRQYLNDNDLEIKNEIISHYNNINIEENPSEMKKYETILSEVLKLFIFNKNKHNYKLNYNKNNVFIWKIDNDKNPPLLMDFSKPPVYNLIRITNIENNRQNLEECINYNKIKNININLDKENHNAIYNKIVLFLNRVYESYIIRDKKCWEKCNIM